MSLIWFVVLAVWLIGIPVSYKYFISKWNKAKGEKIYFSIIWPLVLPLYLVHLIHNS